MIETTAAARNDGQRPPAGLAGLEPEPARAMTDRGHTRIAGEVVAKIAGHAAREIPGVHSLGAGPPGRRGTPPATMRPAGVSVRVDEREASVDLDLVTWYGQSILDVAEAVRRNVIDRVEAATGLIVLDVDITVDDVVVPDHDLGAT